MGKVICPGFCYMPCKPWPLGNDHHTILCGNSGILHVRVMIEDKGEPKGAPPKDFLSKCRTVG